MYNCGQHVAGTVLFLVEEQVVLLLQSTSIPVAEAMSMSALNLSSCTSHENLPPQRSSPSTTNDKRNQPLPSLCERLQEAHEFTCIAFLALLPLELL